MTDADTATTLRSEDRDEVRDHAGVRIGSAGRDGAVVDFAGVRIGIVDADGTVSDFAGVRIGRRSQRRPD